MKAFPKVTPFAQVLTAIIVIIVLAIFILLLSIDVIRTEDISQKIISLLPLVSGIILGFVSLTNGIPQWLQFRAIPILEYGELLKYDMFKKYPQMDQPLGEYYYL